MTKKNWEKALYVIRHKKAFLETEKELRGHITFSGIVHDTDKLMLLLLTPLSPKTITKFHRAFARHHLQAIDRRINFEEVVIDWECARKTKPDKQLTAYETLMAYYPGWDYLIIPVLKKFKLI